MSNEVTLNFTDATVTLESVGGSSASDVTTAIATHNAVTLGPHGIADTSALDTVTARNAAIAAAIVNPLGGYTRVIVVDSGGNGDYTTFSASALAEIASLSSGGLVLVFSGDYTLSAPIRLPSNVALRGAGQSTRITLAAGSNCDMISNANWDTGNTGIVIDDLYLDGNRINQVSSVGDGPGQSLVSFVNVSHSIIRNVHGTSPFLHGVDLNVRDSAANSYADPGCTDVIIDGCHFTDFGDDGVSPHWSSRIVINNCVCWNAAASYSGSSNGVECDDSSSDITVSNCIAYDCVRGFMVQGHASRIGSIKVSFVGCTASGNSSSGWLISQSTPAGGVNRSVSLSGCRSSGNPVGYLIDNYSGVVLTGCISDSDTVPTQITGNIAGATHSILFMGCWFYTGGAINLNDTDTRNITFSNCVFRGGTATYTLVIATAGVTVTGCTVSGNDHGGIQITAAGTGCKLVGNNIYGNADTGVMFGGANGVISNNTITDNQTRGLYLYPAADNIIVSSNRIWYSGAGAPYVQSYGIRAENTAGIVEITDNIISGGTASVQIIALSGTGIVWRDNLGFVTEANGTATVANGTTSIAVNHGLALTPEIQDILVTPTNDLGNSTKFWISNPTSTQFTINVDADPGAGTATFAWAASIV